MSEVDLHHGDRLDVLRTLPVRTEGHYCLTCASYQCEHAHATYADEEIP